MLYIITFLSCLLIDSLSSPQNRIYRLLLVGWVIVFLCFGYMTGSDWRDYELIYEGSLEPSRYAVSEWGFDVLLSFFGRIISDFWIFNALCKMAYLGSFVLFMRCFTDKVWTAVGVAFVFSLLFILIDCPMRFMISLTFIQLGFFFFNKKRHILGTVLFILSILFHVSALFILLLLLSSFLFKNICRLPIIVLFIIFIVALILPSIPAFFDILYSGLSFLNPMERIQRIQEEYSEYEVQTYRSIGFWKTVVFGSFLILSKKYVLGLKNGQLLFYYSFLFIILSGILSCVPTGFRLGIINGYFFVIVIIELVNRKSFMFSIKPVLKSVGIIALLVLLSHTVMNDWKYTPYSNSIKYILTDHLPYSYRDMYNPTHNKKQ